MSTQSTTTAEAHQALGTIEYLHPETLELEANVRDDVVELDKEFLASLREHGVIVPITAVRDTDGRTVVREGQCRILGARAVGLDQVPVFVLTTAAQNADAAAIERIVHQLVANDQRSGITSAQRARAIQTIVGSHWKWRHGWPDLGCADRSVLSVAFVSQRKWRFVGNTAQLARVDDLLTYSTGSGAAPTTSSIAWPTTSTPPDARPPAAPRRGSLR